jgi:tetratricopeptide (TPR) repeat protein
LAGSAFVLVAGLAVVRGAVVASDGFASGFATTLAPTHPELIKAGVMAEVGRAAALGEQPRAEALEGLERLARGRPLAAEPFLVHGAIALQRGEPMRAETLLAEARRRDPRAPAARYLLADLYLRTGRPLPAMAEMSVLHRLLPNASGQLAPALAAYAQTPGARQQLEEIVENYPELEPALLLELAGDARHVGLVLALAGRKPGRWTAGDWQQKLIGTLIERGDLRRARDVWQRLSGVEAPSAAVFNPGFATSSAPPPFNWTLTSDQGGVAEATSAGLQVLYYGRADLDLASQTMLLPPGRYRLAMTVSGDVGDAGSLRWTVNCLGSGRRLVELPLPTGTGPRQAAAGFAVPPGDCAAQRVALSAEGREFPKEAEFRISGFSLGRAGPQ